MDEARRVLDRLRRIDALRRAQASPPVVLREVRALLGEGEAWLAAERASSQEDVTGTARLADVIHHAVGSHGSGAQAADAAAGEGDAGPIGRATVALGQLDTALASRAADALDEEVMPERRAI